MKRNVLYRIPTCLLVLNSYSLLASQETIADFRPEPITIFDFETYNSIMTQKLARADPLFCEKQRALKLFLKSNSRLEKRGDKGAISKHWNYLVIKSLGKGSYGEVFLVKFSNREKIFSLAIKKEISRVSRDQSKIAREFSVMAAMAQHPNSVQYYGTVVHLKNKIYTFYSAMEHLFTSWLNGRKYTMNTKLRLAKEAASALATLHAENFGHFDLRASNIMVRLDGSTCIIDFGFAQPVAENILFRIAELGSYTPYEASFAYEDKEYHLAGGFDGTESYSATSIDTFALALVTVELCLSPNSDQNIDVLIKRSGSLIKAAGRRNGFIIDGDKLIQFLIDEKKLNLPPEIEEILFKMLSSFPTERPTVKEFYTLLERSGY